MKLLPCFGKTLGWASYRKYHTIHSTFAIYLLQTLWSHRLPALVGQSATADFGLPEPLLFYSVYFSSYTKDFAVTLPLMLRSLAATSRPHHYICVLVICSIFKKIKKKKKKNSIVVNLSRAFTGDQSTKDTQQVSDPDSFLSITAQDTVNPFSWYSDFSRLSSVFTEDQSANDKTCLGLFRPSLQVRLCFHNFNTTAAPSRTWTILWWS